MSLNLKRTSPHSLELEAPPPKTPRTCDFETGVAQANSLSSLPLSHMEANTPPHPVPASVVDAFVFGDNSRDAAFTFTPQLPGAVLAGDIVAPIIPNYNSPTSFADLGGHERMVESSPCEFFTPNHSCSASSSDKDIAAEALVETAAGGILQIPILSNSPTPVPSATEGFLLDRIVCQTAPGEAPAANSMSIVSVAHIGSPEILSHQPDDQNSVEGAMETTPSELSYATEQASSPAQSISAPHPLIIDDPTSAVVASTDAGSHIDRAPPSRQGSFSGNPFVSISMREHVRRQSRRYGSGSSDGALVRPREAIADAPTEPTPTQSSIIPSAGYDNHTIMTTRRINPDTCVDDAHATTDPTAGPALGLGTPINPSSSPSTNAAPSVNVENPGVSVPNAYAHDRAHTRGAFFIGNGAPVMIDESIMIRLKEGANGQIDFLI